MFKVMCTRKEMIETDIQNMKICFVYLFESLAHAEIKAALVDINSKYDVEIIEF